MDLTSKVKLIYPVIGCTGDCEYCYARQFNGEKSIIPLFNEPQLLDNWKEQLQGTGDVFMVTGMSDLADWKQEWVTCVFDEIEKNPQNQYLFLTKRPDQIKFNWNLPNVWLGVSVTNKDDVSRIDILRSLNFTHKFVAFEPLLEDVGIVDLNQIEWISVGKVIGEKPKSTHPSWIRNLVKQFNGPVLMKSSLKPTVGSSFRQELPFELEELLKGADACEDYLHVIGKD